MSGLAKLYQAMSSFILISLSNRGNIWTSCLHVTRIGCVATNDVAGKGFKPQSMWLFKETPYPLITYLNPTILLSDWKCSVRLQEYLKSLSLPKCPCDTGENDGNQDDNTSGIFDHQFCSNSLFLLTTILSRNFFVGWQEKRIKNQVAFIN